jgi:hypothetical protein
VALEVIGAGFGRTGTLSLKLALEKLGFDACYHMAEVVAHPDHVPVWAAAHRGEAVDWDALFHGYRASVDWPACNLWQAQFDHWPDARIVLSLRDPDRWYDSVMNTIHPTTVQACESDDPAQRAWGAWTNEIIWDGLFGGRMHDRAHAIDVFERHNEFVKRSVPEDRLLVFEAAQGWDPLCTFLERPIPDEDFPRVNSTADFQTRSRR